MTYKDWDELWKGNDELATNATEYGISERLIDALKIVSQQLMDIENLIDRVSDR